MMLRGLRIACACALAGACLDPTEITIHVLTNFSCTDLARVRITVASNVLETATCSAGDSIDPSASFVGTLVVVPGQSGTTVPVDITVTAAVRSGTTPAPTLDACEAAGDNGGGCIVARRSLELSSHHALTLPILIDNRCATVTCGKTETCIAGACVLPTCAASGSSVSCGPDGGVPDGGLPPALQIKGITARGNGTCVWLATGDVICWGSNDGQRFGNLGAMVGPTQLADVSNVASISLGGVFACALTSTNAVECWGDNLRGELGDGTTTAHSTPKNVVLPSGTIAQVTAGTAHVCALTTYPNPKVYCWGSNVNGQSAQPANTPQLLVPTLVNTSFTFFGLSAGATHTCAIGNANGGPTIDNVYCWGSSAGVFGTSTGSVPSPTLVPNVSTPDTVASGSSYALANDGTTSSATFSWGSNAFGQTNPTTTNSPLAPAPTERYLSNLAAGDEVACGTDATTTLCWGDSSVGELGPGVTNTGPATIPITTPLYLAAGARHVCAVTLGLNTDEVWCWGDDSQLQLGTTINAGFSATPIRVLPAK